MTKFIVVSGGVISGLGKGIITSSIGFLLKSDFKVTAIKLDPYLNIDSGTMNPKEHGEVYVLDDGFECDMDFGHYERFIGEKIKKEQSITMGQVFLSVFENERSGKYLGQTVQMIPHVTNEIINKILDIEKKSKSDFILIELGGTIGDIEANLFIEALRQLKKIVGSENICYCHLTYVLKPKNVLEHKTKPTQQSINLLLEKGISPDFLFLRSEEKFSSDIKDKISLLTNITEKNILMVEDLDLIYKVPQVLESQNLMKNILKHFDIKKKLNLNHLKELKNSIDSKKEKSINILIFGKYSKLKDSYVSIYETLNLCSLFFKIKINFFFSDENNKVKKEVLKKVDGVIIPGGFGKSGIEEKINIIKYARENKIPLLGICLGAQLMTVEFLRNVCKLKDVNSCEIKNNCKNKAVILLEDQKKIKKLGGTMRLGVYSSKLKKGLIYDIYKKYGKNKGDVVFEKHRHRYEINSKYHKLLEKNGLKISGLNEKIKVCEFLELDKKIHPFFIGTQSHPELNSKINSPNPLFLGFVQNILKLKEKN